jgi:hypothetical protein
MNTEQWISQHADFWTMSRPAWWILNNELACALISKQRIGLYAEYWTKNRPVRWFLNKESACTKNTEQWIGLYADFWTKNRPVRKILNNELACTLISEQRIGLYDENWTKNRPSCLAFFALGSAAQDFASMIDLVVNFPYSAKKLMFKFLAIRRKYSSN